jgi:adenylate cyclase
MPRRLLQYLTTLVGIALACGSGWFFLRGSLGEDLLRFSYNYAYTAEFVLKGFGLHFRPPPPSEVCLIYMTEASGSLLGEQVGYFRRATHARLLRRLTAEGARAVFLDIVFDKNSPDPGTEELVDAVRENGRVFLAAGLDTLGASGKVSEQIVAPDPKLRQAAKGWGIVAFRPYDPDYCVRSLYAGTESVPSVTWKIATALGAPLSPDFAVRAQRRFVNYYGAVDCFSHLAYDEALDLSKARPGFFSNKIVVIGGRYSIGNDLGKDVFTHPLTQMNQTAAPGVEIQATILVNLWRQEWLTQLPTQSELWIILGYGLLLALVLPRFTPFFAILAAVALSAGFCSVAFWLFFSRHLWLAWAVPALIQTPVALGWAVTARYFLIDRRRRQFRRAFAQYLSPRLAARMDVEGMSLAPGGSVMETSIVFTDLEGFTTLSEELGDPARLAALLVLYFTRTTAHVLENDGTLIKYIGDAVFAVWGAPEPDPRHADKAATAACRMLRESEKAIEGRYMRTRIGLHTGHVLAGNLGSPSRFDYTCIGDPVNVAARLEGLNKYVGTGILLSDDTLQKLTPGRFVTRPLGRFRVLGKKTPVAIHQMLGEEGADPVPDYLGTFARGLEAYRQGELAAARELFHLTISEYGGEIPDGPSKFYLKRIEAVEAEGMPERWDGVVDIIGK